MDRADQVYPSRYAEVPVCRQTTARIAVGVNPGGIADVLKQGCYHVGWRSVPRENGKLDKKPIKESRKKRGVECYDRFTPSILDIRYPCISEDPRRGRSTWREHSDIEGHVGNHYVLIVWPARGRRVAL